jgi:hypothetical protein
MAFMHFQALIVYLCTFEYGGDKWPFTKAQFKSIVHCLCREGLNFINLNYSKVLKLDLPGSNVETTHLHNKVERTSFGTITLKPPMHLCAQQLNQFTLALVWCSFLDHW